MGLLEVIALLRDLVIILLGIVWVVAGVLVALLAWFTWRLVKSVPDRAETVATHGRALYGQAQQILGTTGESARTAREAVTFVSEKAVVPTIAAVSAFAGVRQFVSTLFSVGRRVEEREAP